MMRNQTDEEKLRAGTVTAAREKQRKQDEGDRLAVDAILKTEEGRRVWGLLFRLTGYNQSSLIRRTDGEVSALSTECMEAQRLIYIKLRKKASLAVLLPVEARIEEVIAAESQEAQ